MNLLFCIISSYPVLLYIPSRHLLAQWRRSGIFIVNFEHISHLVLVFLLLTCRLGLQQIRQNEDQELLSHQYDSSLERFQQSCVIGRRRRYLKTIKFQKNTRSNRPEVFLVKVVLKKCSKFTGEHPCRSVTHATLLKSHFGMGALLQI